MIGTPQYMSPEQARGRGVDRPHRHLRARRASLFEMLTGRPPFVADNAMDMVAKHLHEPPPRAVDVAPGMPPALDALVLAHAREGSGRSGRRWRRCGR